MPLTLRPTGLSRDPNAQDWNVFDGDTRPVGRIYQDKTAPTEGACWAWFLQVTDAYRSGVKTTGRAAPSRGGRTARADRRGAECEVIRLLVEAGLLDGRADYFTRQGNSRSA